jgi:hypothetical protein
MSPYSQSPWCLPLGGLCLAESSQNSFADIVLPLYFVLLIGVREDSAALTVKS